MSFFKKQDSYLGIDIGTNGIKIVELTKSDGQAKLLTYGFSEKVKFDEKDDLSVAETAEAINEICKEAGVSTRNAIASLPTFSVFSSIIHLPDIGKGDKESAVHWEAKKVIPLPLEEMILDYKDIEGDKILLTAAPKNLVKKYLDIFQAANFNLLSLETETFSIVRALIGNDKSSITLVEIGASTTDVSVIKNNIPEFSRSIDVGGASITSSISKRLNIAAERAEQFKYDLGVNQTGASDVVPAAIMDDLSPIVNEIKYANSLFENKNNEKIEKIILSGGSVMIPGLVGYFSKILNKKVIIGNPWSRISYPLDIEPLLNEIGPRMTIAVGLAMRGLD